MKRFKSWLVDEIDSISCALRNRFNRRKHHAWQQGYDAGYLQHEHDTDPQTAIDRMVLYGRPGVGKNLQPPTDLPTELVWKLELPDSDQQQGEQQ